MYGCIDVEVIVMGPKGMIAVVRKTGHSSYYVEKGMNAMGKTPKQLGIQGEYKINGGGELPVKNIITNRFN